MDQVKIMHTADLHLGSELKSVPERSAQRKQELLSALRRITQICAQEAVDILLIAGDLFEGANAEQAIVASVKEYLGAAGARVFISPGNHDYVALGSPYLDKGWPHNVTIFKGGAQRVDLDGSNVSVFGAGFESTYIRHSLLPSPEAVDPARVNLCVVHGDVVTGEAGSDYHPITPGEIAESGMDYLALGHIHLRKEPARLGRTVFAYPGCPEGRGFDETGEKGVYIGTVQKGSVQLEFRPLARRLYLEEALDVSNVTGELDAVRHIMDELKKKHGGSFCDHLYRLTLTGRLPQHLHLPLDPVCAALSQELFYVTLSDETRASVDYEFLAKQTSIKGVFVRRMLEKIRAARTDREKAKLELALEYGMRGFDGEVMRRGH